MLRRIWTLFSARNREFYRDKSTLGWNVFFPLFIIVGFSVLFSSDTQNLYKVGIVRNDEVATQQIASQLKKFREMQYLEFIEFKDRDDALYKLNHHRIDLLVDPTTAEYWVSKTSPKGYVVEKILQAASLQGNTTAFKKQSVIGREVTYIEWLFPGILGMNIMFSSLFGVGYVVVRYRKNGVLKRMSVTPVRPYEFMTAQIMSRIFVLLTTTAIVYTGTVLIFGFENHGSYLALLIVFALGGFTMTSLGLLVASRIASEELAEGFLNIITWPMMFLSEVWFSLEGARPWVKNVSGVLPLTHLVDCARKVINDGASIYDLRYQLLSLAVMALVFLTMGSLLFKWQRG